MIKKVFKESFLYTFANNAPLLVNIFILPIITPYLTSNDYGIYGLALAYTGALSALANLGFIPLFQNSFFKDKENFKEKWGQYFGILFLWKIFYGFIVAVLLWVVFHNKVEASKLFLILFLVTFPIVGFDLSKTIGLRLCQYTNNHKKVYTITFITSILAIGTTFIGVFYFKWGYMAWFISNFITSFIQFLYFFYFLYFKNKIRPILKHPKGFVKNSLKFSLPLIPHEFSGYLLETSDRVILDISKTNLADIGQYNLAYSFSNYFKSFNNAMNTVLSPIYLKLFSKKEQETSGLVKNITLLWFYFILFVGFFLCLWLKEIFHFLYRNPDLNQGYYLAIFIIIGFTYEPFYVASVIRAIFHERSKSILKISFVAGIINLILNLILIPYYGLMAAVLSTFVSYLYMGFSGFFIKEIKEYITESYNILALLLLIISTGIAVYFLKDVSIPIKMVISFSGIIAMYLGWIIKGKKMVYSIKAIQL